MNCNGNRPLLGDRSARTRLALIAPLLLATMMPEPAAAADAPTAAAASLPACQPKAPGGALLITESCADPLLGQPYVDVRKPGKLTDRRTGLTVEYLYVHGGFTGTDARFAFYFPPAADYRGRFFQTTYPTLGKEDAAEDCQQVGTSTCSVAFALANGAYVVSTNNAGGIPAGGPLAAYRANAAAARYSRVVAAGLYGTKDRPRGYIYGASGGAYQTVGAMENTAGVWDGAVPMVFGVPNAIPNFMTAQVLALRALGDKAAQVADAVDAGGSGNPFDGLTTEQRAALREAARLGMPLRGWWRHASLDEGGLGGLAQLAAALDPTYVADFWSKPGYAGSEPAVKAARIVHQATVIARAGATGLVLSSVPSGDLADARLVPADGAAKGQARAIAKVEGNRVDLADAAGIEPGAVVTIDNSAGIALRYFHRYQPADASEYGFAQFTAAGGPVEQPRRARAVGAILSSGTAGAVPDGSFSGRMIMVGSVMDVLAYPWSGDWYRKRAQALLGPEVDGRFRLWYVDNADHGPDMVAFESGVGFAATKGASAHIVGYIGAVEQALLDLDDWVVRGTPPPATSGYRIDELTQVRLESSAKRRHGVQPVLIMGARSAASGRISDRVETRAGLPVRFSLGAEAPRGAGRIVKVEWDFSGTGRFEADSGPVRPSRKLRRERTYAFATPGTYFVVARVTSQRDGYLGKPFGLVQNLARVRVVVR